MKTLKTLIVEDNAFMATVLQDMLQPYVKHVSVVGIAHSGKDALKMIARTKPNVLFLDVELPDMTGFELLNKVSEINFRTVFITAHSQYAIKAFRFNALDYLVKPIVENELNEAIKRCLHTTTNTFEVQTAISNFDTQNLTEQKLVLPTQTGTLRFALKHITHIGSERNYSYVYLTNGTKELSSKNLAHFEEILKDKGFFRSHRSFLINKVHIEIFKKDVFVLKNGMEIPISRRKKSEAKHWFL